MQTYAIKGDEKILVTEQNKDSLEGYKFIQEENLVEDIKQKYNSMILEKYPYYKQINMGAEIQEIHLIARQEERSFTESEMMKVGEGKQMKDWIQKMRDQCEKDISEVSKPLEIAEV